MTARIARIGLAALTALLLATAVVAQRWWVAVDGPWVRWDAYTSVANADRLVRLGGTYYTAGAEQKGPLWPALYDLATHLSSDVWASIAVLIVLVAVATAAALAALLVRARVSTAVAIGAAAALIVHLCFGPDGYARVLYSRNLVALLETAAAGVLVASSTVRSRRRTLGYAAAGGLVGLAAQTNLGSLPAAGVGLLGVALLEAVASERRSPAGLAGGVLAYGAAAFGAITAPIVIFQLDGVLPQYLSEWWTYNLLYSTAYGTSLPQQLVTGAADVIGYYVLHPLFGVAFVAFVAAYLASFRVLASRRRVLGGLLLAWWAADCVAVALAQREFNHYFVLVVPPTFAMGALVLDAAIARVRVVRALPTRQALAAAALVIVAVANDAPRIWDGVGFLVRLPDAVSAADAQVERLPADVARLRTVVDELTTPDDFVYIWTDKPWLYADVSRSSATRYVERRWLTGEIFFAGESPSWILPDTLQNWAADMRMTPPAVIVTRSDEPLPADGPVARLVACAYSPAYTDAAQQVYRRTGDVAGCLPSGGPPLEEPGG